MKRRTKGRRVGVLLLFSILLLASAVPSFAFVDTSVKAPTIDSKSAKLYSVTTDETVFERNPDKKVNPYSTTKLMTALLAAENLDLKQEITVTKEAAEIGESTMWLDEGEVVTAEQLLYGTLIESGNDAACMLGIAVAGDTKSFTEMMNRRAEELGCTNTHFVNANGLKEKNHYTTASDFLLIAKAAFENDTVRKVAGTKKYDMPATNMSTAWTMETHLPLLETKGSGVIAGKTGYWEADDCSVVLDYDKKGLNLILVLFESQDSTRTLDAKNLLKYGRDAVRSYPALETDQVAGAVRVRRGAVNRVSVLPEKAVLAYPKEDDPDAIKLRLERKRGLEAPIREGDEVGTIEVEVDGKVIAEVKALAAEEVATGWFPSYFYITNRQSIVIGLILLLLILLRVWLYRRKKRKKERIAERRAMYQKRAAEKRAKREAELYEYDPEKLPEPDEDYQ